MPLPRVLLRCQTSSSPMGSCTAGGQRSSPLIKVNMVVLAPMPRARERMATSVSPRVFPSVRIAYLRSCQRVSMISDRRYCGEFVRSVFRQSTSFTVTLQSDQETHRRKEKGEERKTKSLFSPFSFLLMCISFDLIAA